MFSGHTHPFQGHPDIPTPLRCQVLPDVLVVGCSIRDMICAMSDASCGCAINVVVDTLCKRHPVQCGCLEHDPCTNTLRQQQGTRDHGATAVQLVIVGYTAATPLGYPLSESQDYVLQVGHPCTRFLVSCALS